MRIPPPANLPAFPDARHAKPRTAVKGGGALRKRWKDSEGRIYEWDSRHGTVELFDPRGKHLGEFDPNTGRQLKPANPHYTVDP